VEEALPTPTVVPTVTPFFIDWLERGGGFLADQTALAQLTFIVTAAAMLAGFIAVYLMIRLRSAISYVSFLDPWEAVREKGRIWLRGRIWVQPAAGGYMITGIAVRTGLLAFMPLPWAWRRYEIASTRAGTSPFTVDSDDHWFPLHLIAVAVRLADGTFKKRTRLLWVRNSATVAAQPASDTADSQPHESE